MPRRRRNRAKTKSTDLGTINVRGRNIPHWLNSDGTFGAKLSDDEQFDAESLKGLIAKIDRRLSTAPLNIRFIEVDNYSDDELRIRTGVIKSIHAGNGNPIVQFDESDSTEQVHSYRNELYRPDMDIDELKRRHAHKQAADASFESFKLMHRLKIEEPEPE